MNDLYKYSIFMAIGGSLITIPTYFAVFNDFDNYQDYALLIMLMIFSGLLCFRLSEDFLNRFKEREPYLDKKFWWEK